MTSTPKTIQIFLPSGEPHGTRIVQVIEAPCRVTTQVMTSGTQPG